MQPHFLSCHYGDRVSQQRLNDLTQFYLHPVIRRTDDEQSVEPTAYSGRGIMELINAWAQWETEPHILSSYYNKTVTWAK